MYSTTKYSQIKPVLPAPTSLAAQVAAVMKKITAKAEMAIKPTNGPHSRPRRRDCHDIDPVESICNTIQLVILGGIR